MADTKISDLTAVASSALADELPVVQSGVTKKATVAQILAAMPAPTLPSVVSVGSSFSSTGVPTATLPGTHAADDILLLVLQFACQAAVTPPVGYARLGPQNGVGQAVTAASTKLAVFWKRDNGAEGVPTIPDSGDHTFGVMLAIRGCPTVGDPFQLAGINFKATASTTGTASVIDTSIDNCLVLDIFAHATDAAAVNASSPTNSGLANVTEQFDGGTADGTGGGLCIVSGEKASHDATAPATTITWANSTMDVSMSIVFLPDAEGSGGNHRMSEVAVFIGDTTGSQDYWTKPTGARRVKVQMIDGGGSGSSGRNAATATGGGGGGGGGYCEAEFIASQLPAEVPLQVGKGGASQGDFDGQTGNAGTRSFFGNAGAYLGSLRVAGIAATAPASGDGGNGGSGSGSGTTSPAVATTRIDMTAATAGAAFGGVGGRGGSGTTAPVGGGNAERGGGGGESGGDSDAAIAANGNGDSQYGGGGGGGGRTSGTVSVPGRGGGAAAPAATAGLNGIDSTTLPYGGSGGVGGNSTTRAGNGGFPGGGGGGGGSGSGTQAGGVGGHGCIVVTTYF